MCPGAQNGRSRTPRVGKVDMAAVPLVFSVCMSNKHCFCPADPLLAISGGCLGAQCSPWRPLAVLGDSSSCLVSGGGSSFWQVSKSWPFSLRAYTPKCSKTSVGDPGPFWASLGGGALDGLGNEIVDKLGVPMAWGMKKSTTQKSADSLGYSIVDNIVVPMAWGMK